MSFSSESYLLMTDLSSKTNFGLSNLSFCADGFIFADDWPTDTSISSSMTSGRVLRAVLLTAGL